MGLKHLSFLIFLLLFILNPKIVLSSYKDFIKHPSGEYIVVLEDQPSPYHSSNQILLILEELEKKVTLLGGKTLQTYSKIFFGAHVRLSPAGVSLLRRNSWVKSISKNEVITLSSFPPVIKSWGLDRIDQKNKELDDAYVVPYTGKDVHVYVVDTGLKASHEEFQGRVGDGYSPFGEKFSAFEDCNGHGTHVSGTVLGTDSGVAREAVIHPVRVFKCLGGTTLDVILSGMEWVITNHKKPAVMNMSLGGSKSEAWDQAVKNTVEAGITVVVAAGNSSSDACSGSPSGVAEAITVAASDRSDRFAGFSNWGECIDIIAPGVDIVSAGRTSDEAFISFNGTSMASPHVAGAVALLLEKAPHLTPSEVEVLLMEASLKNIIPDTKGSPNNFLHVSGFFGYPRVLTTRDQLIRLPQNTSILLGQAEDYDGQILLTEWKQIFGQTVNVKNSKNFTWEHELNLKNLVKGDYGFRFKASDNDGHILFQESYLFVRNENTSPSADAGYKNKISATERIFLDGTRSHDPDGNIMSYLWQQVDGPSQGAIANPESASTRVDGAVSGNYQFRLTVKDNEGAISKDIVHLAVNFPPLVEAGPDQFLEAKTTGTLLQGSVEDKDGLVAVSLWSQRSGPSSSSIVADYDSPKTEVTGLEEGTYVFELIAMDDSEDIVRDTVRVVVKGSSEEPNWPRVTAGADQTIKLPNNSTALIGSCEAKEGLCVSTSWSLVSSTHKSLVGEEKLDSNEIYSSLRLKNLTAGVYTFRFTGKDSTGKENSDDVVLRVLP